MVVLPVAVWSGGLQCVEIDLARVVTTSVSAWWICALVGALAGTVRELEQWLNAAKEDRAHSAARTSMDGSKAIIEQRARISWPTAFAMTAHPPDRLVDIAFWAVGAGLVGWWL